MIVKQFYMQRDDGVKLFKTYSDKEVKIQKIGTPELYHNAIDVETAMWQYQETSIKIPEDERLGEGFEEANQELTETEIVAMLEEVM